MPGMVKAVTRQSTLAIAKPDALRRGLLGKIIERYEAKGLTLEAIDHVRATPEQIRDNYRNNEDEPWFGEMVAYMTSGPLVPMVWSGPNAIDSGRQIIGSKDPWESDSASLRGLYAADPVRTLVHGARDPVEAIREIGIWFPAHFGVQEDEKMGPGPGPDDRTDGDLEERLARQMGRRDLDLYELKTFVPLRR